MLVNVMSLLIVVETVTAQSDGNFWWLNNKFANYRTQPEPLFEDLTDSDTDESSKIVFRDNLYENTNFKVDNYLDDRTSRKPEKLKLSPSFHDKSKIDWPNDSKLNLFENGTKEKSKDKDNEGGLRNVQDILEFKFPDTDNLIWQDTSDQRGKNITNLKITTITNIVEKGDTSKANQSKVISVTNKIPLKIKEETEDTEHICTFMKKADCGRINGVINVKPKKDPNQLTLGNDLICCVVPLVAFETSKIHFIDDPTWPKTRSKRHKRSEEQNKNANPALKQRIALLLRKYNPPRISKLTPSLKGHSNIKEKIVTPDDDYVDPYWNIKNSNFQNPRKDSKKQQPSKYEYYDSNDSVEDYVVEVPSPGLIGLYSDHNTNKPNWSFSNDDKGPYGGGTGDDDDDDPGTSFGYGATIDPRLQDRTSATSKRPISGRLTIASSEEQSYDANRQTITYQSNPDFQVLPGFKLLNLMNNKSRLHKSKKKTNTAKSAYDASKESVIQVSVETDYDDFSSREQVYKGCGRAVTRRDFKQDTELGATEGSHPWLALVVLTRKRQSIICYATLVHTRAAVTAGDCVQGRTSPGEISIIVGARNLKSESQESWQKRMASIYMQPQYRTDDIRDLAILHWKRPLTLDTNVQPVCLADPHVGDDCGFHGWGGYDQGIKVKLKMIQRIIEENDVEMNSSAAIRPRPRWQKASILSPRACNQRLPSSKRQTLPEDAFCAEVQSPATVTGLGGPLICEMSEREAAVGVAVWRDDVIVLIPAHEWTVTALRTLHIL